MMDLKEYEALKVKVIKYVGNYQESEYNLPTIRQLAIRFKVRSDIMLQLVEDADELTYNIGVMVQGVGTYQYDNIGDYTVEVIDAG